MIHHFRSYPIPKWLLVFFTATLLIIAANLPLTQDEAYYFNWAKMPYFGYFDHPPAVAILSLLSQMTDYSNFFNGRLATCFLASFSLLFLFRLYSLFGFKERRDYLVCCLFAGGNFAAIAAGILTTPDTVLMFFWSLALHEAAYALKENPKRWLGAGVAVGLGLLSKYTMVMIGPVFLFALLRSRPEQLARPWPYLGGLLALLIFLPNLLWNSQNNWVSLRFQLKHGLAMERANLVAGHLPKAQKTVPGDPERLLEKNFHLLDSELIGGLSDLGPALLSPSVASDSSLSPLNKALSWLRAFSRGKHGLSRFGDFLGGQLAFFGFLLFPMLFGLVRRISRRTEVASHDSMIGALMVAASVVPLSVFAFFAMNAKVEANWAAMSIIGSVPILQRFLRAPLPLVVISIVANYLVLAAVVFHTLSPIAKVNPGLDRLLQETHGFDKLAQSKALVNEERFFADRFQLVSLLRYYNAELDVGQWPGITRASEYVLRAGSWDPFTHQELHHRGYFHLLTSEKFPPRIEGFAADRLVKIRDCRHGGLEFHDSWLSLASGVCSQVQGWSWVRYRRTNLGVPDSISRF